MSSANTEERTETRHTDMRLISRAAAILRALANDPAGLSLGQLAGATGLPRATVQRVVGALAAERLVAATGQAHGVRLGAELARIAAAVHRDIIGLCRPALNRLSEAVQDTVDLTMLHGAEALVIHQMPARRPLRVVSQPGATLPLHCTASGKAHLALLTQAQATAGLLFTDDEEFAPGICALATALPGLAGGNYAIAVSLPKQHFAERRAAIGTALHTCRADILRAAGL
jgi:DNA-binding IclR family transcriptional regulator